ncbi:MAG: DNA polymerase I [Legionellales bacterium]|nr:DNA polymerase I [Legionellales bacterium]
MQNPERILIDGSSYLYRAFHAMPPLMNSKGQPTGAIYGVVNMLKRLLKDYDTKHVIVVFDPKGKTFRDDLYPAYKANRPSMPDDLRVQIAPLFEIIKAMGLPLVIVDGVEADDVIGTMAKNAVQENKTVLISTGDKDMAQLVDEHVTLINTMNNKLMDIDGVQEKFGVPPELIIDYLTLIGDTVDNVPGVPKVGPKTAVKWLLEYGNLDNIIANADNIKGKVGENLRESITYLPLSKKLVTIKVDVTLPFDEDELIQKASQKERLIMLYREMEFKTWLSELLSDDQTVSEDAPSKVLQVDYQTVLTETTLENIIKKIKAKKIFAIDTETNSLNYMQADLIGISLAIEVDQAYYIPLAHDYLDAPEQLSREYVLQQLKPLLTDENIQKVGHNLKYDISIFAKYDIELMGVAFDTMLEAFLLESGSRLDMDTLALKFLGHKTISFEDVAGKGAKQISFNQVDIKTATQYAAEDADVTLKLHHLFWSKIKKDDALAEVLTQTEMPLVNILSKIERTGVLIDADILHQQSTDLAARLQVIETQAFERVGAQFNMNSPKQLQKILFEDMGIPVIKKTPTGQPATSEEVLQELAHDYPLPKLILEYRSLSKLKSTYTDKLPLLIDRGSGRVHTSYHQVGAATGRFSSSDPNLQNIPIRTVDGRKIRQAFIAPEGYQLLAADYSQIELRIMAHLSEDKGLCDAFAQGLDIHKATAAEVFSVALDDVTDLQRRSAKAINFGLIYGMSAFGLAKQLHVERADAQAYIDMYFERYPGVKAYMTNIREQAHSNGYVETYFGRKLHLPAINAKNKMQQNAAERAAINAPMQGTAADIIKRAMIKLDTLITSKSLPIKIVMQVHDELIFEVANDIVEEAKVLLATTMENAVKLHVPLVVDVGVGINWDEAH